MQLSFSMLSVLSHHTKQHDAVCICVPVGVGALLGRFQMTGGSCRPSQLVVQFTSEGSTLSGCDIQLVGTGYRLSLIKKRFAAGQFEYQRCVCVCVSSWWLNVSLTRFIWLHREIFGGQLVLYCEWNQKNQWLFDCEDYGSIPCLLQLK